MLVTKSEQKVTLLPPTVGMCAILAHQVLTQRKKPRPMTYFDLWLWICGSMAWALQKSKDILKNKLKRIIQTKSPPKHILTGPSFLEQVSLGKPLAKEIVWGSPVCNRVA